MASINLDVKLFYRAGVQGDNLTSTAAGTSLWRESEEEAVEDVPELLVKFGLGTVVQIGSRVMTADKAAEDNALIEARNEEAAKAAVKRGF